MRYVETSGDHWIWLGGRTEAGRGSGVYYGAFGVAHETVGAHRVAYLHWNGPIPDETPVVRHTCHISMCCKPEHLILGTQAQNIQDMVEARRQARGSMIGSAGLTEAQVLEIYAADGYALELAECYGVGDNVIRSIKRDQSWQWLTKGQPKVELVNQPNKGNRKLSDEQRAGLLTMFRGGEATRNELAHRYSISQSAVSKIIRKAG